LSALFRFSVDGMSSEPTVRTLFAAEVNNVILAEHVLVADTYDGLRFLASSMHPAQIRLDNSFFRRRSHSRGIFWKPRILDYSDTPATAFGFRESAFGAS
jgi:hypothetical protein